MGLMCRKMMIGICLTLVLGISSLAQAVEWQDVAGDLMSPACPGRTLLNCTSSQAEQWRELIRQKLAQGESKGQIIQHFVDIEGESIPGLSPKARLCFNCMAFSSVHYPEWGGDDPSLSTSMDASHCAQCSGQQ